VTANKKEHERKNKAPNETMCSAGRAVSHIHSFQGTQRLKADWIESLCLLLNSEFKMEFYFILFLFQRMKVTLYCYFITAVKFNFLIGWKLYFKYFFTWQKRLDRRSTGFFLGKMCSERRKNHYCWQKKPEGTSSAIFNVGAAAKCCDVTRVKRVTHQLRELLMR